jgi:hypothetical protein
MRTYDMKSSVVLGRGDKVDTGGDDVRAALLGRPSEAGSLSRGEDDEVGALSDDRCDCFATSAGEKR